MKLFKLILKELFYVLTACLVAFLIMEVGWHGIVLAYINFNLVLILWIIIGILILMIRD